MVVILNIAPTLLGHLLRDIPSFSLLCFSTRQHYAKCPQCPHWAQCSPPVGAAAGIIMDWDSI